MKRRTRLKLSVLSLAFVSLTGIASLSGDRSASDLGGSRPLASARTVLTPVADLTPPTLDEMDADLDKSPHYTPASLIRFAETLSDRMRVASASLPEAETLFTQLKECVLRFKGRTSPVTQALCLNHADRLSQIHAELSPEYKKLLRRAPTDAKALTETLSAEM
jgi:hypothetical protein